MRKEDTETERKRRGEREKDCESPDLNTVTLMHFQQECDTNIQTLVRKEGFSRNIGIIPKQQAHKT